MKRLAPWAMMLSFLGGCPSGGPTGPAAFAIGVVSFEKGAGAGFGDDQYPDVVLGPPEGGGEFAQSTDVLSLGKDGEIILELGSAATDGPGADLLIFENAFSVEGSSKKYVEPGEVSISSDGENWHTFPCDNEMEAPNGCAGYQPVLANSNNDLDPMVPEEAGGDAFDLAQLGVDEIRFVRIVDKSVLAPFPPSAGFDLDAVAAVYPDGDGI